MKNEAKFNLKWQNLSPYLS